MYTFSDIFIIKKRLFAAKWILLIRRNKKKKVILAEKNIMK